MMTMTAMEFGADMPVVGKAWAAALSRPDPDHFVIPGHRYFSLSQVTFF